MTATGSDGHVTVTHSLKASFNILVTEVLDVVMMKGMLTVLALQRVCLKGHCQASSVVFSVELEL